MALVDVSLLSTNLKESKLDYEKIFGLMLKDGFAPIPGFTKLPIKQKVELMRKVNSSITQPGRTGATNNRTAVTQIKKRVGELKPAKVDLLLTEAELYALSVSFLGVKQPNDPSDIHSVAGRDFLMSTIFEQIGNEVNAAIYGGVLGSLGAGDVAWNGGLNLFDGLGVKFTLGYATTGDGAVGDIPGGNKVASPAGSVSESNILAEMKKVLSIVAGNSALAKEAMKDTTYLYLPMSYYTLLINAMDGLTYKTEQVVMSKGDTYVSKLFQKMEVIPSDFLDGVDNMFWTPQGNLFFLTQDTEENIPRIKFQEVGRDLQILIDWENSVDYADGRAIVLYK